MAIAQPEVTASLRADGVTAGLTPEKLLFVGQQGATATAADGALTQNIGTGGEEDGLYDADSVLATAIRRARKRNKQTQFDAIGVDDAGGGTEATGDVIFTGTITTAGTILVTIGSKKDNTYTVPAIVGDSPAELDTKLMDLVNADATSLVVATIVSPGTVILTAKNAGTIGNTIGLAATWDVVGTVTTVTLMAGGATDPVITGILDVIGESRYQGIVWGFSEDLDEVKDFLDARFNVQNNILDGVAFAGITDTFANALAAATAENSQSLSLNFDNLLSDASHAGPAILDLPFTKVAEFAGIRALRRTDGAILGNLVVSRSLGDSFGGISLNSKPYFNTPFFELEVPTNPVDTYTALEVEQLLAVGAWVVDANRPGNTVIAGEVVTTYTTDVAGNPDPTFTFLNYVDTATAAREYIVNNTRAKYVQYRAASGALISGVDSANEASVAAFVSELNADLGDFGLVNQGTGTIGGETVDFDKEFRENLTVTLDPVTGKFSVSAKLFIVVQLRAVLYDLAIAFEA